MVLKKLKPGMTVYDVRKTTGLNRFNSKWSTWDVCIKEIDIEKGLVLASWNSNPPQWYGMHTWSKWRINRPKN